LPQVPNITSNASLGSDSFAFGKHTQPPKFLIAFLQQFLNWNLGKLLQAPAERFPKVRSGSIVIAVRAALRLSNDFVHDLQFQKILRSQFERLSGFSSMSPVSPQNRGAGFRANHRVVSVLENQYVICDPDAQRSARATLADHRGNDGD